MKKYVMTVHTYDLEAGWDLTLDPPTEEGDWVLHDWSIVQPDATTPDILCVWVREE